MLLRPVLNYVPARIETRPAPGSHLGCHVRKRSEPVLRRDRCNGGTRKVVGQLSMGCGHVSCRSPGGSSASVVPCPGEQGGRLGVCVCGAGSHKRRKSASLPTPTLGRQLVCQRGRREPNGIRTRHQKRLFRDTKHARQSGGASAG